MNGNPPEPIALRQGDWQIIERRARTCCLCGKEAAAELPECACGKCNRHLCADCGRTCQDEMWHPDCADRVAYKAEETADSYEGFARAVEIVYKELTSSLRVCGNPMHECGEPYFSICGAIDKSRDQRASWLKYARQMRGKEK